MFRLFQFFLCLLCPSLINASISVQGKSFRSDQESQGKHLLHGYEYYARLQSLPAEACRPHSTTSHNVTLQTPTDGIPVALLVGTGNTCTLAELSDFVRNHVFPTGVVDFLILDDDGTQEDTTSPTYHNWLETYYHKKTKHAEYPFYILTVSYESHFELLDVLSQQTPELIAAGGPRITIDSKSGTSGLWIALAALVAACSCSFLMILQGWLEPEDLPEEPSRPQRRRLTKEQVRQLLPVYRYDGECLHGPEQLSPDMDCCAICLDEYEAGDTVRVMPCNHAFHAKCVGKWLSERSAVCPLCKEDYYIEQEEEDIVEDAPPNTETEESAWSRMYQMMTATAEDEPATRGWFRRWFRPESDLTEPLLDSPAAEMTTVEEGGVTEENAEEDTRSTVSV